MWLALLYFYPDKINIMDEIGTGHESSKHPLQRTVKSFESINLGFSLELFT
jgi:hypothetical protein